MIIIYLNFFTNLTKMISNNLTVQTLLLTRSCWQLAARSSCSIDAAATTSNSCWRLLLLTQTLLWTATGYAGIHRLWKIKFLTENKKILFMKSWCKRSKVLQTWRLFEAKAFSILEFDTFLYLISLWTCRLFYLYFFLLTVYLYIYLSLDLYVIIYLYHVSVYLSI